MELAIFHSAQNFLVSKDAVKSFKSLVRDMQGMAKEDEEICSTIWNTLKMFGIFESYQDVKNKLFYLFVHRRAVDLYDEMCEKGRVHVCFALCEDFEKIYRFEQGTFPRTDDADDKGIWYYSSL